MQNSKSMPSTNYSATLYEISPDEHLKAYVDALNLPHDGSRQDIIDVLMQTHGSWGVEKPRCELRAAPKDSRVADIVQGTSSPQTTAPTTFPLDSTAALCAPGSPKPAVPPTIAPTPPEAGSFAFRMSRHESWADEIQSEVDHMAAVEAKGKFAAEKAVDDSWETVTKVKRVSRKVEAKAESGGAQPTEVPQEEKTATPHTTIIETETTDAVTEDVGALQTNALARDYDLANPPASMEPTLEVAVEGERESALPQTMAATQSDEQVHARVATELDSEPASDAQENVAAVATTLTSADTKKKTASRRPKQKRAAKKAAAAVAESTSSDGKTGGAGEFNELIAEISATVVEEVVPVGAPKTPTKTFEDAEKLSGASSVDAEKSEAVQPAVADDWDDYISSMPTIQAHNFHVAHLREFEAEEEAQARFAAGLPPADDGPMTAADLQRIHEEAEKAKQSDATHSTTTDEAAVSAAEESEGLPEPKTKLDEVELSALQPSASADEPEIVVSTAAEDLPVPVPEVKEDSPKYARQFSITDFFKKAPVKVKNGSSTILDRDIPASTKPIEAIIVDGAEPVAAVDGVDDLRGAPGLVKTKFVNFEVPPAVGLEESNAPSDTIEEDLVDSKNVADYLDYLESDDEQSEFEHTEGLPATSATAVSNAKGAQASPQTLPVDSSAEDVEAQEELTNANNIDEDMVAVSEDDEQLPNEATSPEPVVTRQKKKRSKAQRNAAKKQATAAIPATVPASVLELPQKSDAPAATTATAKDGTAPEHTVTGRGERREKRTGAEEAVRATTEKDAKTVTVMFAENLTAKVKKADGKDQMEAKLSERDIVEAYTTLRRKGKKAQKNNPSGAQRRKVWKPNPAPLLTPSGALVAPFRVRLVAALARGYQIGTFNLPWFVVLGLVLAWLFAIGTALYDLEPI